MCKHADWFIRPRVYAGGEIKTSSKNGYEATPTRDLPAWLVTGLQVACRSLMDGYVVLAACGEQGATGLEKERLTLHVNRRLALPKKKELI